ncbi:hypothetical protein [Rhodobacter sp. 24-YEA-8]|uniref:hypothetical protein n=1 Tax=Rhodobacter sp. 24-YEA-8 TaxID=1884310 RepID=UPI00089489B4|nr:hypothetical protein [Rhodobacter sp. 24-YEA-8]SEB50606.1 hypothetical protein SAMN05519105_0557 [Rhodobacter sp. 24-YEA-8]
MTAFPVTIPKSLEKYAAEAERAVVAVSRELKVHIACEQECFRSLMATTSSEEIRKAIYIVSEDGACDLLSFAKDNWIRAENDMFQRGGGIDICDMNVIYVGSSDAKEALTEFAILIGSHSVMNTISIPAERAREMALRRS